MTSRWLSSASMRAMRPGMIVITMMATSTLDKNNNIGWRRDEWGYVVLCQDGDCAASCTCKDTADSPTDPVPTG